MRIALEVWSNDYAATESACLVAEDAGIDAFYYGESPNDLNLECWTTLAALAGATTSIRLGPVIANVLPTYRSLSLLIKQIETVREISSGRLDLRTGAGAAPAYARPWWEPFGVVYPGYAERLSTLRDALGKVRSMPSPTVPITVAASGEAAMRVAAEFADTWETSFCTPAEFAERNRAMRGLGARSSIQRSLEIDGFIAADAEATRSLLERARADRHSEDLDTVLTRALVGEPGAVSVQIRALAAAGVDQLVVALHDPLDREAIALLAHARDSELS